MAKTLVEKGKLIMNKKERVPLSAIGAALAKIVKKANKK